MPDFFLIFFWCFMSFFLLFLSAVKEKDEVECSTSTPQILPSVLTPDICSSDKAPLVKKCTRGRAKKTMPGSPRLELLKGALSKSAKQPSESKAPVESSDAAEVVTCGPAAAPRACPLLMRQNIRRSLSTLLCRRSENVYVFIQTFHYQKTYPVN